MNRFLARRLRCCSITVVLVCALQPAAPAGSIPVRHLKGTVHGFLALRSKERRVLAVGNLFQVVRGDRVTSRVLFRFKDGSVDDESAVFSQGGNFQLITDRHVQKGPSFPHPIDLSIDVRSGQVTVRSTGKDGTKEITTEHLDLPDLVNRLLLSRSKKHPAWFDKIMEDEIFGPLLPILTYSELGKLLAKVKSLPKPLAGYVFSRNQATIDRVLQSLSFGGGAVNQTNVFLFIESMPYCGLNTSTFAIVPPRWGTLTKRR
jgi:Aldehyde dehydrogenase family